MIRQDIEANMPFVVDQFNEQMDNTIKEAKGEVEAFVQNKMNSLAVQALKEGKDNDIPKLDSPIGEID